MVVVEDLSFVYHPGTPLERKALDDVSLRIRPGECVGIIGPTGSGKTTLVQHFNGLLKPSSGKIHVDGVDLGSPGVSLSELRRKVGLVFQYPEHQIFEETVFAEISFVLRQQKAFSAGEIAARVKSACVAVGLNYEEFSGRSPFELSGGEMRRVALAGVLVQDPRMIIFDEPTVGLDGPGKQEVLREIRELHRSGKTTIIVSHSVEDLPGLVDRLIVLEEGRIAASGAPEEVFSSLLDAAKLTFLVPPLFRLLHELRASGWPIPEEVHEPGEALRVIDEFLRSSPGDSVPQN